MTSISVDSCFNAIDWTPHPLEFFRFRYVPLSILYITLHHAKNTSLILVYKLPDDLKTIMTLRFFWIKVSKRLQIIIRKETQACTGCLRIYRSTLYSKSNTRHCNIFGHNERQFFLCMKTFCDEVSTPYVTRNHERERNDGSNRTSLGWYM